MQSKSSVAEFLLLEAEKTGNIKLTKEAVGKLFGVNKVRLDDLCGIKDLIEVGDSPEAVQFRKWVAEMVEEYVVKGYVLDDALPPHARDFGRECFRTLF